MSAQGSFIAAAALLALTATGAGAENAPGVTATEIKIGQTMPYSGPASSYGVIGRSDTAFFRMINDKGGINGRKIVLISADDGYNPARAFEQTRKLVESDNVAFIFDTLGTPSNSAVQKYLNERKIPQLFPSTGADKWGNYQDFPWTIGFQPSYRTEAEIYAKYILKQRPNAKIAVLYQNDDFGKDYLAGLKDVLADKYSRMVIKEASYEVSDPTIDAQIITLQSSGADTFVLAATPKFAVQAIRKVYALSWKPMFFMTNVSTTVASVLETVGTEKAIGIISAAYQKDPADPAMAHDPGMRQFLDFMQKYMPDADQTNANYISGYNLSMVMTQVLKQCGNDLSRENIMRQAANLRNLEFPGLLPGILVNSSPTNYHAIRQFQLMRWNGHVWELFGNVLHDSQS